MTSIRFNNTTTAGVHAERVFSRIKPAQHRKGCLLMKKDMLINVQQPEECRIAVLENDRLDELYMERKSIEAFAGNIYRGKIVNLEPSIQAAFVDFGVGRNGFLHISDVDPQYFRQGGYDPKEIMRESDEMADAAAKRARETGRGSKHAYKGGRPRVKPPIQEIFRRGDEVLVQVIKEGIGTKGPTLSTYISIPGRYLVLMPSLMRVGVSRKIEDEDDRKRLKRCLLSLNPPKGLGFIVRTAGAGRKEARTATRPGLLAAFMESDCAASEEHIRTGCDLRRKRFDHPHDPRYLQR